MDKYGKNKKIKFYNLLPQNRLFKEIYPQCDIFVYPSFTDSFGFGIIEAMSFGIPIVSVGGQSRKELIKDGKTGFVINEPRKLTLKDLENLTLNKTIKELEKKVEILIEDKELRREMAKNCIEEIKNGKFSIKERNKKLVKIYEEAVNINI